jgi:hypothetical protein
LGERITEGASEQNERKRKVLSVKVETSKEDIKFVVD